MSPSAEKAWSLFHDATFQAYAGTKSVQFSPHVRVWGREEAEELARRAFEAGLTASGRKTDAT